MHDGSETISQTTCYYAFLLLLGVARQQKFKNSVERVDHNMQILSRISENKHVTYKISTVWAVEPKFCNMAVTWPKTAHFSGSERVRGRAAETVFGFTHDFVF